MLLNLIFSTLKKTQEEWQVVFIISSCVYLFGCFFYTIFGDCEPISNQPNESLKKKESMSIKNINFLED